MVTWAWCGSSCSASINRRSDSNELHQIPCSQSDSSSAAVNSPALLLCFLREGQPFTQMEQGFDYAVLHYSQSVCLNPYMTKTKKANALDFPHLIPSDSPLNPL